MQSLVMNEFWRAYFLLSCTTTFFAMYLNKNSSVLPMSQCYVIKQMVNAIACTIELRMHLGGLKKLESHSAIPSCDSYASFVLSNLPRAPITQ